jgi:ABC-type Fe3+-hydroxamate transport system substrate-binding protein
MLEPKTPSGIVSLVPSQTELLVYLGLEDAICGITKFCVHPEHLRKTKQIVGGTKNLRMEVIEGLQPALILANKEENEKTSIEALAAQFNVWVSDITNWNAALEMILSVGNLTDTKPEAERLVADLKMERSRFEADIVNNGKRYRTLYLIWRKPWMSVGGDTFISEMMDIAGFDNCCSVKKRYPILEAGEIQSLDPEIILLSSEPYPFTEKHIAELQKLAPKALILLADGEMFSWYGSRMLQAFSYFERLRATI